MRKTPANYAFGLLEMLVSIAIILILALLISGVIQQSLARIRDMACLLNLRQIGIMLHQATAENSGYFPSSYRNTTRQYWFQQLATAASADLGSEQNPESPRNIFMCPKSRRSWAVEGGKFHGNYGWNISYGNQWDETNPSPYILRLSRFNVKTQEAAVVADVNAGSYTPPYASHWFSPSQTSYLDFRHANGMRAHVLFADGSARAVGREEATYDFFDSTKHKQP